MQDQREIALNYIRLNGPVIPVQVSKVLNTNILFASAVLSELVEKKHLRMSHAAIGSSKVYYIKGQEAMLGDKLYGSLNPIEKEVFNLLKERKVLRDKELEPKERIALRDLKDFAMPLTITAGNQSELFWKFYIISDEDVKKILEQYVEEAPAEVKQEFKAPDFNEFVAKLKEELIKEIAPKLMQKEILKEEVEKTVVREEKKEERKDIVKDNKKEVIKEIVKEEKKDIVKKPKKESIVKEEELQEKEFVDKTENRKPEGKFYKEILDFFNDSGIKIVKEEMVKKEKEYDFIVKVLSAFGAVSYFVKARDKKAFNDADVSLAYSAGQLKGLPTILLGRGKLNKKAVSLIDEKLSGKFVFKEFVKNE